jgi:hypothetical protein
MTCNVPQCALLQDATTSTARHTVVAASMGDVCFDQRNDNLQTWDSVPVMLHSTNTLSAGTE